MQAMMTGYHSIESSMNQKRKRSVDDACEVTTMDQLRQCKRQTRQKSTFSVCARLPTPEDSSDDEDTRSDRDMWYHRRGVNNLTRLKTGSMSSVHVHLDHLFEDNNNDCNDNYDYNDDDNDDAMDMVFSPVTPTLSLVTSISSSRSDSMFAPSTPPEDRIATPTTMNAPYKRRSWHSQLHTTVLSPVMAEEYTLPSPRSPLVGSSMSMNMNMNMDSDDLHLSSPQGCTRKAKLHVGFRPDCEKCAQKVPGHYSHIVWS